MIDIIFHEVLYRPLLNSLIFIYEFIPGHDLGIAIIILTILIKVILLPLSQKSIESQKALSKLQPEIKKIQAKYKNDKEKQARAIMEFYKQNKINPASGCLPLLIQLPILIALYKVFLSGLNSKVVADLYSFMPQIEHINPMFLGRVDLSERSIPLAVIAGGLQYIQTKMITAKQAQGKDKKSDFASIMNQQMLYMMPIMTAIIALNFPAGLPLYWIVVTLFTISQQYFIMKKNNK